MKRKVLIRLLALAIGVYFGVPVWFLLPVIFAHDPR